MNKDIKGIKPIISMKSKNSDIPSSILNNANCITLSTNIANIFNDFIHSVASAIQSKIKCSCKSFNDHLHSRNYDSFTINPRSSRIRNLGIHFFMHLITFLCTRLCTSHFVHLK